MHLALSLVIGLNLQTETKQEEGSFRTISLKNLMLSQAISEIFKWWFRYRAKLTAMNNNAWFAMVNPQVYVDLYGVNISSSTCKWIIPFELFIT